MACFRLFDIIGIKMMSPRNFWRHQDDYLNKVVKDVWNANQEEVLKASRSSNDPTLAGDARCDSMGHRCVIDFISHIPTLVYKSWPEFESLTKHLYRFSLSI